MGSPAPRGEPITLGFGVATGMISSQVPHIETEERCAA